MVSFFRGLLRPLFSVFFGSLASVFGGSLVRVYWSGLLACVGLVVPGALFGQDVSARAFVTPQAVAVGEVFTLNLEIAGTQSIEADPLVPDLSDFAQYLGAGTSTNMQTVNGQMTVAFTVQYRFRATAEGSFPIGAISVQAGGETMETEVISLTVTAASTQATAAPGAPSISPEDVFVTVEASKTRVVVNEPIAVEYRLFTRVNIESYSVTNVPATTGFWVEELDPSGAPQVEQVVRNGVEYATALVRNVVIFPTASGSRTLAPLDIEAQVRIQRQRTGDPFADFFDRSSFGSRVTVPVSSPEISIEVDPLPPAGQPSRFAGHVGALQVSSSLDRDTVEADGAVTFTVVVRGEGNIRVLSPPELTFAPEFEIFPPEASAQIRVANGSVSGTRTFEYVLIPRVSGVLPLPEVVIPFFDASEGGYATATASSLSLVVLGDRGAAGSGSAGGNPSSVDAIREDIRFIHVGVTSFSKVGASPYRSLFFWLFLLIPAFSVVGALGVRRHKDRLEGDVAYARVRRAHSDARRRLAEAEKRLGGDPRAFNGEVAGALRGFLADKLNLSAANLDVARARQLAQDRGVSEDSLEEFFQLLEQCDFHRFTPAGSASRSPKEVLEKAAELMSKLEGEVGRG